MGIIKRNEQIYAEYRAGGVTLRELATKYGVKFQRVWQICQRQAQIERQVVRGNGTTNR